MVLKGLIQDSMEQGVTKAYPTPPSLCTTFYSQDNQRQGRVALKGV